MHKRLRGDMLPRESEGSKFELYNTLLNLTEFSVSAKNEVEFLNEVLRMLTDTGRVEGALVVDKKLNIKFLYSKVDKHKVSPEEYTSLIKIASEDDNDFNLQIMKALKYKKIYIQNNTEKLSSGKIVELRKKYHLGSWCIIPIIKKDRDIGAIILISKHTDSFDKEFYKLLNIIKKQITLILNVLEKNKFHNMILSALDVGFDFVIIMDKKLNMVYSNKVLRDFSGYSKDEIIGEHHSMLHKFKENSEIKEKLYDKLLKGEPFSGVLPMVKKDGTINDFISTIIPYKINGKVEYYIFVSKQLSNEEKLIEELDRILHYDKLTDLPSYNSFLESLKKIIQRATTQKLKGAIAVINPISFKSVNEAFGFDIGNKLLKVIATRLKESVFQYDMVAKLESDRFGLILRDLKYEENVVIALSRIIEHLKKPYQIDGKLIHLSFNIGISLYPKDGQDARELINKARVALTEAKEKGENQIGFFRKNFELTAKKILNLKSQLHKALKNKEFVPYFQPYVDGKGNIVGAESLLRWKKVNGIVPPMDFIPYLEQTDLIKQVELQVLENVIKVTKTLKKRLPISVNMSAKSLRYTSLFENIMDKINKHEIDPSLIKIEIVERSIIDNFHNLNYLMEKFKAKGIQFAIDDFGTGYSSLSYLSKLKVESIKIDISFVKDLTRSIHTKNVVEAIIFLSKKLNIKTIAEGVETKEQFLILKDMGCDFFQGYLFFRPMPEDEFLKTARFTIP